MKNIRRVSLDSMFNVSPWYDLSSINRSIVTRMRTMIVPEYFVHV